VPEAPHLHCSLTVWTLEGIATRALLLPLPGGQPGDDLHRTCDDALPLGQGRLQSDLHLGKRLGGLHPVIPDTLKPCGHRMLNHAADKRVHSDGVVLHPVGAVGAVMVCDPLAIVTINAPDGDRRADHILGHLARHTLIRRGDGALLHVRHQAVGVRPATGIHQRVDGLGLQHLASHRQQMPLPRAAQERRGPILEMLPAFSWPIVASTGGEQMEMGG
jgi:hypothetical protein